VSVSDDIIHGDFCFNNTLNGDSFVNNVCSGVTNIDDLLEYSVDFPSPVSSYVHTDDSVNSFDDGLGTQGAVSLYSDYFNCNLSQVNDLEGFNFDGIRYHNANYGDIVHNLFEFDYF
jgi:hypothetical protein